MELWTKILGTLLTPPGLIILVALFSFLVYIKRTWLGALFFGLTTALLIGFSVPLSGHLLIAGLQDYAPPLILDVPGPEKNPPQAIVVLGAGRIANSPEYGRDTVNAMSLQRIRYAAHLQQKTKLPILVSGGAPYGEPVSEAELMRDVLRDEFRADVKWVESKSANTLENARLSQEILAPAGIRHVYLVTHAWHMRRAAWAFEVHGLGVVAAPTGFNTLSREENSVMGYIPSARGLSLSGLAMHERLGYWWYTQNAKPKPREKETAESKSP